MQPKVPDPRIQAMFAGDRRWAVLAVVSLWLIYGFVFWKVLPVAGSEGIVEALAVAGGLVLLFNSASIFAMVNHYAHDKDHIYGLDIHYLDLQRNKKS